VPRPEATVSAPRVASNDELFTGAGPDDLLAR
jgi:hypothetical protein